MQKSLKGNFMELTKKQKVIFNIVAVVWQLWLLPFHQKLYKMIHIIQ